MAFAMPSGGQVVGGSANIDVSGNILDIYQQSHQAIIDWRSFDIGVDEHAQFHQPSSSATTLNRVTGGSASTILGTLTANGNVVLINPDGVFFGKHSMVDVNGLIATTADIKNDDFMAGNLDFTIAGNPEAAIINEGTITAKEAGLLGLVAPNVINSGIITARLGKAHLASGDTFTVDLYGDGLYNIGISEEVASQLIQHSGEISAEGGTIAITAAAAKEIVNSLIHIEGELKAPTVSQQGGKIIIAAEGSNAVAGNDAAEKGQKQGQSTVMIRNALIDASGTDAGEQGGHIEITGDHIAILENTLITASGFEARSIEQRPDGGTATLTADKEIRSEGLFLAHENRAGGSIKIGGDYLGQGQTATARYVYVDPYSLILNNALHSGDAGRTIIWSDDTTHFYGNVLARGGDQGGNGGFLETSGKIYLDAQGYADLTALQGYKKGTYLLDPADITIHGNEISAFDTSRHVVHLDFDEGSGVTAADSSGNINDGTLIGGVQWSANTAPTPQANSFSADVNNGADYVDISDDVSLHTTDVTLATWIYIENNAGTQVILGKQEGGGSGNSYALFMQGGRLRGTVDSFNPILQDTSVLANDTWHHIAYTFNDTANTQSLYINGSLVQTGSTTSSIDYTDSPISIGLDFEAPNGVSDCCNFQGLVDDVRIYNTDLSANDVSELYGTRFTVAGLETMSATADIILQADNTITLDLQGDILNLSDDRSITLQTTNGNIGTASTGTITTNRTTTGGNISFTAGGAGDITIDHALTLNAQNGGDVTFAAGGDITVNAALDKTVSGSSAMTLEADNSILLNDSITSTGGALNVTLHSDADNSGAGNIQLTNADITTLGGNIVMGGGTDPLTDDAMGTSTTGNEKYGVYIDNSALTTNGGDVAIRGEGFSENTVDLAHGIYIANLSSITTTSGDVTLTGTGGAGDDTNIGITLEDSNVASSSGDILITGQGGSQGLVGNTDNHGISITNSGLTSTGNGSITFNGIAAAGSPNSYGFRAYSTTSTLGDNTTTGDIIFNIDSHSFEVLPTIETTGTVTIAPYSADTTVGVAGGAGDLQIDNTFLGIINANASDLVFGRSDGTGIMNVSARDWLGENITFHTGSGAMNVMGDTTNAGNILFDTLNTLNLDGNVTALGNAITFDDNISTINLLSNVTMNADTVTIGTSGIAAAANDFTLRTDNIAINGTVDGTGVLHIYNETRFREMALGDGAGAGNLISTASLNNIGANWDVVEFISNDGALNVAARNWNVDSTFFSSLGTLTVLGAQDFGTHNAIFGGRKDFDVNGGLSGTGSLTLRVFGSSNGSINIGDDAAGNGFRINDSDLAQIQDGWSEIIFTTQGFPTSEMIFDTAGSDFTFSDPVRFLHQRDFTLNDNLIGAVSSDASFTFDGVNSGDSQFTLNGNVTSAGDILFETINILNLNGNMTALGNAITFGNDVLATNLLSNVTMSADTVTIGTSGIAAAANDLTLLADEIDIAGNVSGTGDIQFMTQDVGQRIEIGSTDAARLNLTATELGYLQEGWNSITIGDATHAAEIAVNEAVSFSDHISIINGTAAAGDDGGIDINAGITTTDNANLTLEGVGGASSTHANQGVFSIAGLNVAQDLISNGGIYLSGSSNIGRDVIFTSTRSGDVISADIVVGRHFTSNNTSSVTNGFVMFSNDSISAGGDITIKTANRLFTLTNTLLHADGNIIINADEIALDPTLVISGNAGGTTSLTFLENGGDGIMGIGGTAHQWDLNDTELATIEDDFATITFGSGSMTGNIEIDSIDLSGLSADINVQGNAIDIGGVTLGSGDFSATSANAANITVSDVISRTAIGTGVVELLSGADIVLNADITTSSATADALVLSALGDFLNNAGSDALSATNSRWLVYSDAPTGNTRDGLLPTASDFNKTYASDAPATIGAGNRFVYATATQPTLVYQVSDGTVEYGDAFTGTPSLTYSSGLVGDDTTINIGQTGSASTSNSYSAGDDAGVYNNVLSATTGTLANPLGYVYSFMSGDMTVTQAPLTVALANANPSRDAGAANPAFDLDYTGFKLAQNASVIDTAPIASTPADANSAAGNYAITLAGGSDTNYSFVYTNPAGTLTVNAVSDPSPPSSPSPEPPSNKPITTIDDLPSSIDHTIVDFEPPQAIDIEIGSAPIEIIERSEQSNEAQQDDEDALPSRKKPRQSNKIDKTKSSAQPRNMNGLILIGANLLKQYGKEHFDDDELYSY